LLVDCVRLYGFPSPDSDYDLRAAHVLPLENVLSLDVHDETVQDSRVILRISGRSAGGYWVDTSSNSSKRKKASASTPGMRIAEMATTDALHLYRQCHSLGPRRPDHPKSTTTSTISQMGNVHTKSEITASTKRM